MDTASIQLGYLTILQDALGYSGGYLVTNAWGRPLEFRLTSAVQPTKVQQLLYGPTLRPYLCADVLGKSLLEKSTAPPSLIITDCDAVLELRLHLTTPVVWLAPAEHPTIPILESAGAVVAQSPGHVLACHAKFAVDVPVVKTILQAADLVDLAEPFARIREAFQEAKKLREPGKAA